MSSLRRLRQKAGPIGAAILMVVVVGGCGLVGDDRAEDGAIPSEAQSYVTLAEIDTDSYDAFGPILQVRDSTLFLAYRTARNHVSLDGSMVGRVSTNLGRTWSASLPILRDRNLTVRGVGGGMQTRDNDVLLFHRRGNQLESIRSKGLLQWDDPERTYRPDRGLANSAGNPIRIAGGRIMRGFYTGGDGPQNVYVTFSDDEGRSWSEPVQVLSRRGGGHNYNEASYVHLGDSTLVGLVRDDERSAFTQVRSETNGQEWSVDGTVPFTYGDGAAHPPFLLPIRRPDAADWVVCLYANREEKELRMIGVRAEALQDRGVAAWSDQRSIRLATFTRDRSGYPSAVQVSREGNVVGWYYDEKTTSDADIVVFAVKPIAELEP